VLLPPCSLHQPGNIMLLPPCSLQEPGNIMLLPPCSLQQPGNIANQRILAHFKITTATGTGGAGAGAQVNSMKKGAKCP
jgi:hypothetical protein